MKDLLKECQRIGRHERRIYIKGRAPRDLVDIMDYNKGKKWERKAMTLKAKVGI
jgi:hypothetical protein